MSVRGYNQQTHIEHKANTDRQQLMDSWVTNRAKSLEIPSLEHGTGRQMFHFPMGAQQFPTKDVRCTFLKNTLVQLGQFQNKTSIKSHISNEMRNGSLGPHLWMEHMCKKRCVCPGGFGIYKNNLDVKTHARLLRPIMCMAILETGSLWCWWWNTN